MRDKTHIIDVPLGRALRRRLRDRVTAMGLISTHLWCFYNVTAHITHALHRCFPDRGQKSLQTETKKRGYAVRHSLPALSEKVTLAHMQHPQTIAHSVFSAMVKGMLHFIPLADAFAMTRFTLPLRILFRRHIQGRMCALFREVGIRGSDLLLVLQSGRCIVSPRLAWFLLLPPVWVLENSDWSGQSVSITFYVPELVCAEIIDRLLRAGATYLTSGDSTTIDGRRGIVHYLVPQNNPAKLTLVVFELDILARDPDFISFPCFPRQSARIVRQALDLEWTHRALEVDREYCFHPTMIERRPFLESCPPDSTASAWWCEGCVNDWEIVATKRNGCPIELLCVPPTAGAQLDCLFLLL
jgi:hypothetical protein